MNPILWAILIVFLFWLFIGFLYVAFKIVLPALGWKDEK